MKLFEHPDFDQAVLAAKDHFAALSLPESFIEKDYYVTEALRLIAARFPSQVIFKGGTSLSKGWNLIGRFSEDVDIFLDPAAFDPKLGKNGIDRTMKLMRDAVKEHPGLTHVPERSQTIGGFGRSDRFAYAPKFPGTAEVASNVLVEAGAASGREPSVELELRSYVAQFLSETGGTLGADDETPFRVRLLHFRRTFVEKLFTIHSKIEGYRADGRPVAGYVRHYYDLVLLARHPEVRAMLASDEYERIKQDYDAVSRAAFPRDYRFPADMRFANSEAIYPTGDLKSMLAAEYGKWCRVLCFGPFPSWEEVEQTFAGLKPLL